MKEREFILENIKRSELEEFLNAKFSRAGYSHCDIQRTPLAVRVTVFAQKPGMVIGRGGKIIDEMTGILKEKFGFENPQLDVQEIPNPNLDPEIVGKQIVSSIERGFNYKRSCIMTIERVMNSGATGVAIRAGGKLGGDKSRFEKFSAGYLKFSGDAARTLVRIAYSRAQVKLGTIGLQVRIMTEKPKELKILEEIDKSVKHEEMKDEEVKEMEKAQEIDITYFVHGSTQDNADGKATGHADISLSELGVGQAEQLKEMIKDKKYDVVICSDLKRAVETAKIVFGEYVEDPRLREVDYGVLTQANKKEKVSPIMKKSIETKYETGESYKDVETRIKEFLNDIFEKYPGKKIAIVGHQAPQLALDVLLKGKSWEKAMDSDWRIKKEWKPGWNYKLKKKLE